MPLASVVIPIHERADMLERCLSALEATGLAGLELVLVDDASRDPAMPALLDAWSGTARVVRNAANEGFAAACNRGAALASAPVVVLLNSDTEVRPGWLEPLLEEAADPSVGCVGSRLLYPDGRVQHAGMAMMTGGRPLHLHHYVPGDHDVAARTRDVDLVTGACLAIRRALLLGEGGLDTGFRNGFEDADMCLRLRRAGYRNRYRGDSVVTHHEGMSPGRHDAHEHNETLFRWRWHAWPDSWERALADDGLYDCGWADCRWMGPLLGDGAEAALGRAAIRDLTEGGRRPMAQEGRYAPLAPGAAALCDDVLLAALNRRIVRTPMAEMFVHAPRPDDPRLTGSGPSVLVLGPGAVSGRAAASADVVLTAGADAVEAARAAGAMPARIRAIDPVAPRVLAAVGAAIGPRRGGREGIGWCGPLAGRSGYAVAGRGLLESAAEAGLPVRAVAADVVPAGMAAPPLPLPAQDFDPRLWVVHLPPVQPGRPRVWRDMATRLGAPVVGATCFETERVPPDWPPATDDALEIWVPTRFNLRTFTASGIDPDRLHVVPYPVDTERLTPRRGPRRPGPVTFLSVFEWTWRKGWDVLLQAWAEEFRADDPVRLEILTYRGIVGALPIDPLAQASAHLRALGHDPERIADVELRLDPVPNGGMPAFYRGGDALVLPSRGEGVGMPVLEASSCGLPIIATDFGGYEEIMEPGCAFPVAVERMIDAPDHLVADVPVYEGMRLAEPSVASLRARLRAVAEDPEGAARAAEGARRIVHERFSFAAAARALTERTDALLARDVVRGAEALR